VSTVCASALLRGLVDLNVLDDEVAGVETLSIGVGLSVLEQTQQELGGFHGPASAANTELLSCRAYDVSILFAVLRSETNFKSQVLYFGASSQ
jgi:hypothetical protein